MQEQIFDYIFSHLSIDTEGAVEHPVVMTEPVCNPGYCRESKSHLPILLSQITWSHSSSNDYQFAIKC